MTRALGIVGAAFILALALAPRSADAQQIFACVRPKGEIRIIAQGATCHPSEHLVAWGGPSAGADFVCQPPQTINAGTPISFQTQVGNFGGAIIYNAGGTFFTFAQAGVYQLNFSGSLTVPKC